MEIFIFTFVAIFIIASVLCLISEIRYSRKLPNESLDEIRQRINRYKDELKLETDFAKQSEWLYLIEYWKQQENKLIEYNKKNGNF
jgi:hypothetical protein